MANVRGVRTEISATDSIDPDRPRHTALAGLSDIVGPETSPMMAFVECVGMRQLSYYDRRRRFGSALDHS
ncbi:hypothetical protein C451_09290 [Halococcus thailandensis JCM 13552]|uniref:Uncharacterized protein n=1 Tax=Halococcus thailandensis JCM 13552 TaxID=1227457 RepID=M0N7F4_9EURY|nr:hypothetical protein C451_09290 [Halococcus thailandensis JCM 13552]